VFEVNGEWIVRVPRRPEVRGWLRKEVRLLPEIAPRLPLPLPAFEVAEDGEAPFVAYRKLSGRPIDETVRSDGDVAALARTLGSFLSALHGYPVERASELSATDAAGEGWLSQQVELRSRSERDVFPLLEPDERWDAHAVFEDFFADADEISASLVHGDLGPDHILCERERVTGVIDWTDACVGDPAVDFGWLASATPRPFVDALFAAYTVGAAAHGVRERSLYYHRVGPLHEVLYAQETNDAELLARGLRGFRDRLP
jgi:aminoglycoside phosphotransferase (APT) family kinase protein